MRPRLDPELGVAKKDDDLHVKHGGGSVQRGWRANSGPRIPPRKSLKRLGLLLLLLLAAYVFVRNIPTDLGPQDRRHPVYTYPDANVPKGGIARNKPPIPNDVPGGESGLLVARDNDGPVRFLELAETLHAISGTKGSQQVNKNVLFMASSLKSADILLPIACQMGKELRAYVHFALVSRVEIPIRKLAEINGIGDDCHVLFHGMKFLCCSQEHPRSVLSPGPPSFRPLLPTSYPLWPLSHYSLLFLLLTIHRCTPGPDKHFHGR